MVIDLLLITISAILKGINVITPVWSIYPDFFLGFIKQLCSALMHLNFIFPIGGSTLSLLSAINFFVEFQVYFFSFLLLIKIFGLFRGTKV